MIKTLFKWCIVAIPCLVLCTIFLGLYQNEVAGYFFTGMMAATILANVSVFLSYFAGAKEFKLARAIWISLAFLNLIIAFYAVSPSSPKSNSEMGMLIGYPMSFLSMPSGVFASVLFSDVLSTWPQGFYLSNTFDWLLFFASGYLQWFLIFPLIGRIFTKMKSKPENSEANE